MDLDPLCPMCSRFSEDGGGHLFLRCKPVRVLWKELKIEHIQTKLLPCFHAKDVIAEILKLTDHEKLNA